MRRSRLASLVVSLCVLLPAAPAVGGTPPSTSSLDDVRLEGALPPELTQPEGRTRWDFTGLEIGGHRERMIEEETSGYRVTERPGPGAGASGSSRLLSAAYGGDDALRWLFPQLYNDDLRPGTRATLDLTETTGASDDRLRIDTEIVGIGWLHLPSGPREVVLERALVSSSRGSARGFVPESLIHRFIAPGVGVVMEISGPASPNGRERSRIDSVTILDATISSAANLKIHVSENSDPVLTTLFYGWDRGNGTPVSSLDPAGYANINLMIAANTWNFSGNNTGAEFGATTTPITAAETCNFNHCGYDVPGAVLERSDKNFLDPNTLYKVNDVAETIATPTDVTVWLRAGAQNEGVPGTTTGENRFCYTTVGTTTRTQVPLWKFSHQDMPGGEFYYQAGDSWTGAPFACEQNIFQGVCTGSTLNFYIKAWRLRYC